ncbi:hypothetical protein [Clostridium oryzae]|uniref:DUF1659 domain-containing protein n=1 Tax=Clostridium oryzae TaxID=1450648 RepID=A0A1V4IXX8_9CLOT|nr:hypothetical protein [Clostridium oryzae]OPJ64891.1 hypothetical protein CLORY_04000 [Clostridium oryzae]
MESELLTNMIYITYVSSTDSKGHDTLKTQKFSNIGLNVDDETFNRVIKAISSVMGKTVIEAGKIQKYTIQ